MAIIGVNNYKAKRENSGDFLNTNDFSSHR